MARKRFQWHPLFTSLLRPQVEPYYEVRTEVPVGDRPRSADLTLLRRVAAAKSPFTGLWSRLRTWNLLEYKGPTDAARSRHLPLLVELGLGIARKLGQERQQQGQPRLPETEIAFWYLANRLGKRFLREGRRLMPDLAPVSPGIWQAWAMAHPVYL